MKTTSSLLQAVLLAGLGFGASSAFAQTMPPSPPTPPAGSPAVAPQAPASAAPGSPTAGAPNPDAPTPILLWPQGAPGALGTTPEDEPALTVYLPASNPTRTGILIFPGGGYAHRSEIHEGSEIAQWLNQRGVAAFVLRYRLGPRYHHPIELGDAQRAIRYVRSQADKLGVSQQQIGVWGFSAGGHLAATTGTHFDAGKPDSSDPIEQASDRPDFMVLAYPVISMKAPYVHKGSRLFLLGENPDPALEESLSDETQVTSQTPPTFLYATTDDTTVPVMNSVMFYSALVAAGVPAEMHLFQHGRHGSGLGQASPTLKWWPDLLLHWLQANGWAASDATAPVPPAH